MVCNESNENQESKQAIWAVVEMFKTGVDRCLKSLTDILNILFKDKLPEECMLSSLVPIFKGMGISLIQTLT